MKTQLIMMNLLAQIATTYDCDLWLNEQDFITLRESKVTIKSSVISKNVSELARSLVQGRTHRLCAGHLLLVDGLAVGPHLLHPFALLLSAMSNPSRNPSLLSLKTIGVQGFLNG